MELLKRNETFKKDKENISLTAYYLDLGNGVKVKVKPVFKSDHNILKLIAKDWEK